MTLRCHRPSGIDATIMGQLLAVVARHRQRSAQFIGNGGRLVVFPAPFLSWRDNLRLIILYLSRDLTQNIVVELDGCSEIPFHVSSQR